MFVLYCGLQIRIAVVDFKGWFGVCRYSFGVQPALLRQYAACVLLCCVRSCGEAFGVSVNAKNLCKCYGVQYVCVIVNGC